MIVKSLLAAASGVIFLVTGPIDATVTYINKDKPQRIQYKEGEVYVWQDNRHLIASGPEEIILVENDQAVIEGQKTFFFNEDSTQITTMKFDSYEKRIARETLNLVN